MLIFRERGRALSWHGSLYRQRLRSGVPVTVKGVFDPDWLLNPAKVFPLEGVGSSDRSLRLGFGSHPQHEGRGKT